MSKHENEPFGTPITEEKLILKSGSFNVSSKKLHVELDLESNNQKLCEISYDPDLKSMILHSSDGIFTFKLLEEPSLAKKVVVKKSTSKKKPISKKKSKKPTTRRKPRKNIFDKYKPIEEACSIPKNEILEWNFLKFESDVPNVPASVIEHYKIVARENNIPLENFTIKRMVEFHYSGKYNTKITYKNSTKTVAPFIGGALNKMFKNLKP